MDDLRTPKERFLHFLSKKEISMNACEKELGLSKGFLSSATVEFSTETLRKFSGRFDTLNIMWIIFGTGPMETEAVEDFTSDDHKKYVEQLEARVQELAEHVVDLRDMLRMKKDLQLQASKQAEVG